MNNLMTLAKESRPGVNLALADMLGPRGMIGIDIDEGYGNAIAQIQQMIGLNTIIQVNDCETSGDWTESDNGTFDYAVAATGNRVGTNALKLSATASTDGTQYVQTLLVNESAIVPQAVNGAKSQDWRDTDYIGFWKHAEGSGHFGTDGELEFAIVNDGVVNPISGVTQGNIDVDGTAATEHHWVQIDLRTYDRDKVTAIRFYGNNTNAEDTYIDDIIRYKYQLHGCPLYGAGFPITSGTTLTLNQLGTWSIDGIIASSATEAVADLGPHWFNGATKTGTATRNVWAYFPGRFILMVEASGATVAGEGLISSAASTVEGVSTGVEEKCWVKGLEAAGEAGDHIFAVLDTAGRFIS